MISFMLNATMLYEAQYSQPFYMNLKKTFSPVYKKTQDEVMEEKKQKLINDFNTSLP
jgi:hypothetical protein